MTLDWQQIVSTLGFPIVFALFVLWQFDRHAPKVLKIFHDTASAIQSLTEAVKENSIVTRRAYEENMSVKQTLDSLNKTLTIKEGTDDLLKKNYEEILENKEEIRRLMREIRIKLDHICGPDGCDNPKHRIDG